MKSDTVLYTAAALVCAGWLLYPAATQAARPNFNINIKGEAETCAAVEATSRDGEIGRVTDTFTITGAEARIIELNGGDHTHIRMRGWDRPDYSVEACKIAVSATQAESGRVANSVSVTHAGGRLSVNGPSASDTAQWIAVVLIHAPRSAGADLETQNGPIEVRDLAGTVKLRAVNGPIAVKDCTGTVDAHTTNGPIALTGDRGDVRLTAQNGPIALKLSGDSWNGPQLEARTINGPLAVSLPDTFRTGLRLETRGGAPLACGSALCRGVLSDPTGNNRTLHINGSSDTVRLSTENGPVAIHRL